MKHVYFSSLITAMAFLFFTNNLMAQTCLPNGITFTTQQEIDDFAINYPGCTEILGDMEIGNISNANAISNLNGISQITSVGDDLTISYTSLSTVGLINLTTISGDLIITQSPGLTNMAGLENLSYIGGHFELEFNPNLVNFAGLENLTTLNGNLDINYSDGLVNLEGLTGLTTIGGKIEILNSDVFINMNGLENLTSTGGGLGIGSCYALEDMSSLSNLISVGGSLGLFGSAMTNLNGLSNLTSVGAGLAFQNNNQLINLTGLENLDSISGASFYYNDALVNFEGLNNLVAIDGNLTIYDNEGLINLTGLDNLNSIGGTLRFYANSALINMKGLDNLTTIGGGLEINGDEVVGNNSLTHLTGLNGLTSIGDYLEIKDNNILTDITALDNLTSLGSFMIVEDNGDLTHLAGLGKIDYTNVTSIRIRFNSNLSVCGLANLCTYLTNGGNHSIYLNSTDCNGAAEILNTCSDLAKIRATTYYDINQNEIQDNGEFDYTNSSVLIEPGALSFFPNAQNALFLDPGNYTVSYEIDDTNWQFTTDSASYFLSLEPYDIDTVSFGIYPTQEISEQISYINGPNARCNETITFDISTKNLGTTVTSGTLWFVADSNATSLDFLDTPPDQTIPPNRYGWDFSDLYPSQTFSVQVDVGIPGPPDFPLGNLLNFDALTQYNDVNGWHPPVLFEYHTLVECSFDPNDKLVFPARSIDFAENYTLFDESLYYTVRFQNTGNAVAYDVVIKDTLDANLDWSTFQFLNSSHANVLTTTMDENGILNFDFTDIFLPDSTSNFEGSQGYVSYLIKANEGLAENTIIENSAGIYFDLNPPVITNTTNNVMVSELPTISTTTPYALPEIFIFPNPNTGVFEISGIAKGDYTILNTAGQIIQRGQLSNDLSINISDAPQGVYFISIKIDGQAVVKRIVKL